MKIQLAQAAKYKGCRRMEIGCNSEVNCFTQKTSGKKEIERTITMPMNKCKILFHSKNLWQKEKEERTQTSGKIK